MRSSYPNFFKIVYVHCSTPGSIYSSMLKISITSVNISNPEISKYLIIDKESFLSFSDSGDFLFQMFDEIIVEDVPKGSDSFKSRYLKSKVGLIVDTPFIFLDSDTLVRERLISIFDQKFDIACVLNHNRENINEQIFDQDLGIFEKMGWSFGTNNYFNSGVLFCKNDIHCKKLFQNWHELWKSSYSKTGLHVDQPSFYRALELVEGLILILPLRYNAQIKTRFWFNFSLNKNDWDAAIWHYYGSMRLDPIYTSIEILVKSSIGKNVIKEIDVLKILNKKSPWRNEFLFDILIIFRIGQISRISGFYKTWLSGNRVKAISNKFFNIIS